MSTHETCAELRRSSRKRVRSTQDADNSSKSSIEALQIACNINPAPCPAVAAEKTAAPVLVAPDTLRRSPRRRSSLIQGSASAHDAASASIPPLAPATPPQPRSKNKSSAAQAADAHDNGVAQEHGRCPWSDVFTKAGRTHYVHYHDAEWGNPCIDDKALFEYLVLGGAQCGLNWSMCLQKRAAYAEAYKHYNISAVAAMKGEDIARILQPDSGIVRNRAKAVSAINNARCILRLQREHGSFARYLWQWMPNGRPVDHAFTSMKQIPAQSEKSAQISAALKAEGFTFVGPITIYSLMQEAGMVNDHMVYCFRHGQLKHAAAAKQWPW